MLLGHVTGRDAVALLRDDGMRLSAAQAEQYDELVRRRAAGVPVAHLVGEREFWSLRLRVSAHTLIPRPDTEILVEHALAALPRDRALRILDLGTGSGNIAVAIARSRPACQVTAVDVDRDALSIAADNVRRIGVTNVECIESHWYAALGSRVFDMIVSNPPYIAEGDIHLSTGDVAHEPRRALVAGVDGLDEIRCIVAGATRHLGTGGHVMIEHGANQGQAVRELMAAAGFGGTQTIRDLGGRERVTAARR